MPAKATQTVEAVPTDGSFAYATQTVEAVQTDTITEKEKKKKRDSGRVDVEPSLSETTVTGLEREQQRELLETIQPREAAQTTQAVRAARQAELAAQAIREQVRQEDIAYEKAVLDAENQIKALENSLSGKTDFQYTIDGRPVTKEDVERLKEDLERYQEGYQNWRITTLGTAKELRGYKRETVQAIGDWSRRVVERNQSIAQQKQDFNQRLQQSIGIGTRIGASPRETTFQGAVIQGIPGPAAGPAPGSFGAKLQEQFGVPASKLVREGIEATERPFQAATQPARALAEKMITRATEDKSLAAVPTYLTGVGLEAVVSGVDVATFLYRPGLVIETAKTLGYLATDSSARKQLAEGIKKDPFRFAATTVGGAAIGSQLATIGGKLVSRRAELPGLLRKGGQRFLEAIPEENVYAGMDVYQRAIAREPYTIKPGPFYESPYPGIRSPKLEVFLRELKASSKLRPSIFTEYKPTASLYEGAYSIQIPKLRSLIEEANAATRIRMFYDTYKPTASLYEGGYGVQIPKLRGTLEEIKAASKIRMFYDTYGPTASLYEGAYGIQIPKIRSTLNEIKAASRIRMFYDTYGSTAKLYEGAYGLQFPRLRPYFEEVKAATKLRPPKSKPVEFIQPITYGPSKPKISLSEQVRAINKYTENTLAAKTETFMRNTFKEPTNYKPLSLSISQPSQYTTGQAVAETISYTPISQPSTLSLGIASLIGVSEKPTQRKREQGIQIPNISQVTEQQQRNLSKFNQTLKNIQGLGELPKFETGLGLIQPVKPVDRTKPKDFQSIMELPSQIQIPEQTPEEQEKQYQAILQAPQFKRKTVMVPLEKRKKKKPKKRKKTIESIFEYRIDPLGILKVKK